MLKIFYLSFSIIFLITTLVIFVLRKSEMLLRAFIFSIAVSGLFVGILSLNLFPVLGSFFPIYGRTEKKESECRTRFRMPFTSSQEVKKIFLLKSVLEIENLDKFFEGLDPILRERIFSAMDGYLENMDVCGARKFLESAFGIRPATNFMLKAKEHIEPEMIFRWLKGAEGFIFENKLLLSPQKLVEMFPDGLTGNFEISEGRVIIHIEKK